MADFDAKEVRELLAQAEDADRYNREQAITDLDFERGMQWDERDRAARELKGLPCITVNVAQQYTGQVVGDFLQNETSIKVLPREDGDTAIADIRSELIRSIELQSKASRVFASSFGQMVACGISNFRIDVDYAYEDAFDKDIFIRDIPDPLAVRWDPLAFDPTGRDAKYCFVADELTKDEYKAKYPDAAEPSILERDLRGTAQSSCWVGQRDTILVPEYWSIVEKPRTIGMTVEGKSQDLTDLPRRKWPKLAIDSDTKQPIIREKVKCKYAVRQLTNGLEPLDDPYELRLSRLPIIRVSGREVRVNGERTRFGIIRHLRDDQLMKNYLRSIRTEIIMKAARVNFIAQASSVAGRERDWGDNTLVYADNTPAPTEVTSRNLTAMITEEEFFTKDMAEVTGIFEASRGMPSNETSGRAILARQSEGDTATIVYHTNMTDAQQEAGEVINELIPTVYDTARTIRTVGPDLAVKLVRINDPASKDANGKPDAVDLTLGKYDVTISTGPSYATRRQEGVMQLMELAQRAPQVVEVAADIIVGEMDLVNGQQLQERIKRAMPPQVLGEDADDGKSEEELQQAKDKAQEAQQIQQLQLQMQMQGAQADIRLKVAQAAKAEAEAKKAQAEAMRGPDQAPQQPLELMVQELRLKQAQADQAEAGAALAQAQAIAEMSTLNGTGDPEAMQRLQIEAFNAITKRIVAINPHILQANAPEQPKDEAA